MGSEVRKPPLRPAVPPGCRWCGDPIEPKLKKNGEPRAIQTSFHSDCSRIYRRAQNPVLFYPDIVARNGERCAECGDQGKRWWPTLGRGNGGTSMFWDDEFDRLYDYTPVEYVPVLQVDHEIPLWKIAHLPDDERRWYFTLKNLQLLCMDCHPAKTAKEAAERGKWNRLIKVNQAGGPPKSKTRWPSRKIPSRPMRA